MRRGRPTAARFLHSLVATALLTTALGVAPQATGRGAPPLTTAAPHPVPTSLQTIALTSDGRAAARASDVVVPESTRKTVAGSSRLVPAVTSKELATKP